MPEPKTDWGAVEQHYCEGNVNDDGTRIWPDPARLADLWDVPEARIRERIRSHGWEERRAAFQVHHEKVMANKRSADLAKEATDFDARALQAAKVGLQLVTMRSGEVLRAAAEAAKAKAAAQANGEDYEDYGVAAIDAKELAALAQAAEGWQRIGSKALGEVDTHRVEVTGAGGGAVEMNSTVKAQLTRDDPDRIMGIVVALERAGLAALGPGASGPTGSVVGGVALGVEDDPDEE